LIRLKQPLAALEVHAQHLPAILGQFADTLHGIGAAWRLVP